MSHKDKYSSFQELEKYEKEGSDYKIIINDRGSKVTIIAPHGGCIEEQTSEIAKAISGNDFNFYTFKGIKKHCNFTTLHITSHKFNESQCVKLVKDSDFVVAIHGSGKKGEKIFVGGLDEVLSKKIASELLSIGYNVLESNHDYPATNPKNICNQGLRKKGVQIELTKLLRKKMDIERFSQCIRKAISS